MFCTKLPFLDLGFTPHDENLWIKYTDDEIPKPHIAITTTINPVSQTFVVKDLIKNEMFSTNTYDRVKEYVVFVNREAKLKKLLD